jgi:hypothetical protein
MAECRDLDSGHGDLTAETPSASLRERKPSMDKIMSNFEVELNLKGRVKAGQDPFPVWLTENCRLLMTGRGRFCPLHLWTMPY